MLLPYRAVLSALVPPCLTPLHLTPPRRNRHPLNTLEVVFSTTGDLIRVHSYGDHCSATWDAALSHGRLEPERGDGAGVTIWPDERAWLEKIRTLPLDGWLRSRRATAPGWLGRPLASNATMTEATG